MCVAVSCLSWKFAIHSLPVAFQLSIVVCAVVTTFSDTGLHSMLGFCWHWFWSTRLLHCVGLFPHIFLSKSSIFFLFLMHFLHWYLSVREVFRISCSLFWKFGFGFYCVQTIVASLLILFCWSSSVTWSKFSLYS